MTGIEIGVLSFMCVWVGYFIRVFTYPKKGDSLNSGGIGSDNVNRDRYGKSE